MKYSKVAMVICSLMILMLLIGSSKVFATDYTAENLWDFGNHCSFGFSSEVSLTETPHKGVTFDKTLLAYWNLDEGSGLIAHDQSANGNNGFISGAIWVNGKFDKAIELKGADGFVECGPLDITGPFSVSMWIKADSSSNSGYSTLLTNYQDPLKGFGVFLHDGKVVLRMYYGEAYSDAIGSADLRDDSWHLLTGTWDNGTNLSIYVDGELVGSKSINALNVPSPANIMIGQVANETWYAGLIDDVRVYNRALTAADVDALYMQGDPTVFVNYYRYTDSITDNSLLITVECPSNNNDTTLVYCTNFFLDKALSFQANNSAILNLQTSLGQPTYTTGVWNNKNYTLTLTLNASSTAKVNWNTYNITVHTDDHSRVLPSNKTVAHGDNVTLAFQVEPEYDFDVIIDHVSYGQISVYSFNNITASHVVDIISTKAQVPPTVFIVSGVVILSVIVMLALAFKKGFITIVSDDKLS